ncbi:hypothetical protein D9619_008457 [Psilocybe cf. subviscida]|uniref:Uncharacterized protein n=1 Tax=Psilocybe cf. subviscida TaxID=2480587 RepID=A0A8H5F0D0_9AGAR|nr:hypothetical protein D9619_008457 [Psilocybe cf. subviscida]
MANHQADNARIEWTSISLDQFVYPFTLEPHVITLEASRRSTLAAHAARREAFLRAREDEKERRKRDALRRIAPGFEPHGSLLVPTPKAQPPGTQSPTAAQQGNQGESSSTHQRTRSVMDDLVDQLAALDSSSSSSARRRPS